MRAYLVVGNNIDFSNYNFNDGIVVGIDKGAYLCYKNNITKNVIFP